MTLARGASLSVASNARAESRARTPSAAGSDATATADAQAWGIRTGAGDDRIVVEETVGIEVTAEASGLRSLEVNGTVSGLAPTLRASATGIETGAGDDVVEHAGVLTVTAKVQDDAPPSAPAGATAAAAVAQTSQPAAWGIRTGAGDDDVLNRGRIAVEQISEAAGPGSSEPGIAIDLGPDDDLLRLAEGSDIRGAVEAGTGRDTVRLLDRTAHSLELRKNEIYQVDQGLLDVTSSDVPEVEGLRAELFEGDRGFGQVVFAEEVALADGAESEVTVRPKLFRDQDSFDLLRARQLDSTFEFDATLPEDTPLVRFRDRYTPEAYQVVVDVEPFETVARRRLRRAVARYLEDLADSDGGASSPAARTVANLQGETGVRLSREIRELLGTIQLLREPAALDDAFTSLSPDTYDATTLAALDVSRFFLSDLQRRVEDTREASRLGIDPKAFANLQLAMSGSAHSILTLAGMASPLGGDERRARNRFWIDGLGQWGDRRGSGGFYGFDYDMGGVSAGVDRRFRKGLVLGMNGGYGHTDVDFGGVGGKGDIDAAYASLYGTWFGEHAYVDGILTYTYQDFTHRRRIAVGAVGGTARSDHDANGFGARFGTGYRFDVGDWGFRPFANLSYFLLDENDFEERGAGTANLSVDGRTTHSLVSELGVHVARAVRSEVGTFVPFVRGAWEHDFDVDDRRIVSGLAGVPGTSFPVDGRHLDRNGGLAGGGMLFVSQRWNLSVEYLGSFRNDYTAHGVFARFGFGF